LTAAGVSVAGNSWNAEQVIAQPRVLFDVGQRIGIRALAVDPNDVPGQEASFMNEQSMG
jgi:hypothetical protein